MDEAAIVEELACRMCTCRPRVEAGPRD